LIENKDVYAQQAEFGIKLPVGLGVNTRYKNCNVFSGRLI